VSINSVTISGNLTRDPELRQTQGGMAILSLGVAVNDRRRNPQSGEWEDYANFVDCTVFGNRAEALSKILTKGMKVCINGRLHYRSWQDQNGQNRSKLEVNVNEVDFMSSRNGNGGGGYQGNGGYQSQGNGGYQGQGNGGYQQRNQGSYAASAPQQFSQPAPAAPAPQPAAPQAAVPAPPDAGVYDEDIPF